jgi:hypothetical protein
MRLTKSSLMSNFSMISLRTSSLSIRDLNAVLADDRFRGHVGNPLVVV